MNPSKIQKYEMGSASKIAKHEFIQPGALAAKGRGGKSLRVMGSLRVNAEQRTLIAKNKSCNTATSKLNMLAEKNFNVHPYFEAMEDNFPLYQEAEMTQDAQRSDRSGRGQSIRVTAEKRTPIGKNRSCTPATSNLNKPTKRSILVPPGPFESHKAKKVAAVTRDVQRSPFESQKAKKVAEVTRDVQRSPFESQKAKKVAEVTRDGPFESQKAKKVAEVTQDAQTSETSPCESEKTNKVRGMNICKKVLRLKPGEKLRVTFYQNRVVGPNHASFSRHLGLLVRDRNMCPLRVHSWLDIEEHKLEHMWKAVTEKFDSDDMIDHRGHVLQHMRKLWNNWRGSLHKKMKSKSLHEVLKDERRGVEKSDWQWLVKEHFLSDKFKEASTRNSINRSKVVMPHHTGSKPYREISYEMGGKDGNPPNMATIFFETHKKDDELVEPETIEKYAEIQELVQSEPTLTNIEVVERCFGPQCKSHAIGFGGGITAKELKGGTTSKAALAEELKTTKKEKESLQKRMDILESKYERLERILVRQPSSPPLDQELED
ncbi:uncharacterized protein LOC132060445 [Lycium ferocissimum]|uniref:uncharacterized protein LOC132060445 n=1 Tax=Lycium ferocissimum TaxID=112874 RepID=UPI0028153D21|nr:uncharacterized protein LOC132060445 [Lycium ferocissimum]